MTATHQVCPSGKRAAYTLTEVVSASSFGKCQRPLRLFDTNIARLLACLRALWLFGRLDRMPTENHCSSGPEPVIEFRHASYCLPSGPTLLSDLNLSVFKGETVALLGRSGAGKSTALKLINRMLEPSEGEVRVNGRSTLQWDPITLRRQIGYVIQDVGLFPHYTVEQNVSLVPRLEHWPEERIRSRVAELLELVGLNSGKYLSRHPHELSGGQRQRVGIARALAADPPILLMDEPFGALDPLTRAEVQGEFQKVQQNLGKTIVIVTHHVGEALLLGTSIAVLDAGRLVGLYSARDFFNATEPVAAAYVENLRMYEGAEGKL
jgi:osmoprotectant transport system ATP-binding protein